PGAGPRGRARSRCDDPRIPRGAAGTAGGGAAGRGVRTGAPGLARTRPQRARNPRRDRARSRRHVPARPPATHLHPAPRTDPAQPRPGHAARLTRPVLMRHRRPDMRHSIHALALAVCATLATAPAFAGTPIDQTRPLEADGRVEISNVKGSIEVRGWERNEVHVTGELGKGVEKLVVDRSEEHTSELQSRENLVC